MKTWKKQRGLYLKAIKFEDFVFCQVHINIIR